MRAARSLLNAATGPESARAMLRRCRGLSMTLRQIDEVAATSAGVLIMGDTGVGKELVAEAVHENSPRRGHPFVKVNCGAIPESLMEAELFGYERGAFTGAVTAHKGYFEQANGGTLYLDEIGELSPLAQVRLLRVLETREIQRIGSPKRVLLDFRVIAATNKDLAAQVKTGAFREDLWYRINMYVIKVPALDRRRDDIAVLADYFCRRCAVDLGFDYQPEIRPELMRSLYTRDWPGNVRQLRNWVERALLHTRAKNSPVLLSPAEDAEVFHSQAASGRKPGDGEICTLDEAMTRHIHLALRKAGGRVHGRGNAADILGINPGTLRARMRKLGMTQKPA